jgi:hypothetical protein
MDTITIGIRIIMAIITTAITIEILCITLIISAEAVLSLPLFKTTR